MVETLVAMTILSISSLYIYRSVHQAVLARGMAQEYTVARHLLEQKVAEIEMRPEMALGSESGTFAADGYPHIRYTSEISRVSAPLRGPASRFVGTGGRALRYQNYIGKLTVKIFHRDRPERPLAVGETLLRPGQLWLPEADR